MVRVITFDGFKSFDRFRLLFSLYRLGAWLAANAPNSKRSKEDIRREAAIEEKLEVMSGDFEQGKQWGTVSAELAKLSEPPAGPTQEPMRFLKPAADGEPAPTLRLSQPEYDLLVGYIDQAAPKTLPRDARAVVDLLDLIAAADKVDEAAAKKEAA